jgi:hypothetical protein
MSTIALVCEIAFSHTKAARTNKEKELAEITGSQRVSRKLQLDILQVPGCLSRICPVKPSRGHAMKIHVLLLAFWLAVPGLCQAGPILDALCHHKPDCPKPTYSCLNYWTPTLVRCYERRQGGVADFYTPTSFPEIAGGTRLIQYPCPGVEPAVAAKEYQP